MNKKIKGSAFLLLATILWGSAFVSQSIGMDHIGPFTFQAVRCLLAVVGMLPVIALVDRIQKRTESFWRQWADPKLWKAGFLCGIPLFLACNLQQVALVDVDAGKSAFLTAMYIVIIPIIGIFLKRKTTFFVPISVILATVGLYFLSCVGVTSIETGDLLLLSCAFMFAVQITFAGIFANQVDVLRLNAIQALIGSVLSAIIMLFTETPTWSGIAVCIVPLAHAGFLSMGAAYTLQILGQKYLETTAASLIMSLESVFAVLFGAVILGETMTQYEIIGCILMFIAVVLAQLPAPKKKTV